MKNKTRLLSLLLALPLFLSGCGGTPAESSQPGTSGGPTSSEPAGATVTGVTITGADELTVLDGTRASLKATVSGSEGVSQKVKWSTSNESVATVTNGVVNFLKVSEETKVTITAKAQADETKSASVEFTVNHSPFDLKNSRGNPDYSLYLDDGSFIVEDPQDIALIYADVHDTRWYVEATLQIDSFDMTDAYPKVGIMASERDDGMWCYEQSRQVFYYLDSVSAAKSWSNMNAVPENNDRVDWDWGHQLSAVTASPAVKMGEPFKMGLMRDGNVFYQLYGKATDVTLTCLGSFEYNGFGADANYVWVGGWKTGMTISDPKCIVGDGIDALFDIPEGISLKSTEETLYLGDSYQIEVSAEGFWNRQKLTFTSSDETVATVSEKGLVVANTEKAGSAEITVAIADTQVSAKFTINVTDDRAFFVQLDGKMDDLIWSETVKTNKFLLKKHDSAYINMYGAKNSRGLYLFFDYVVDRLASCNPNQWWTWENIEFRLADDELVWSGQYWVSSMDGGSFVSVGSGEKAEQVYYKALELGTDGIYRGAFEMFVPYGDDRVTKGQATYACFGANPYGGTGWYNSYNWLAPVTTSTLQITENGFAHDGTSCAEGHAFGEWIVDVAATCSAAGSAHKTCAFCGHTETKSLDIDPEAHAYDYANAEVTKVPTCMETGIGTATCTLCNAVKETVLPKDYNNHTDKEFGKTHTYCHDCGIGSYLANAEGDVYNANKGGWDDKSTWYDIGIIKGDFTFTFEFNMKGCQGANPSDPGGCCWRTILPVLYKEGWQSDAATGNRVNHVFRMDWWGWDDGAFTSAANNGLMPDGFDWNINYEAFSNMDIKLVVTKLGADVKLDWNWVCNATEGYYLGKTFEYHQSCTLLDGSQVGLALTAEWTIATITKASLAR